MTLQIFCAYTSPREPPKTVKSWEKTQTFRPEHLPVAGDHPVPQRLVLLQPEVVGAVYPVAVELDEGALVEQQLDALAGGELAALALPLDGLLRGPGAPPPRAASRVPRSSRRSCLLQASPSA